MKAPNDEELVRAYLSGARFQITGSAYWNTLGLGATAMFATTLIYTDKRGGEVTLCGRPFLFMSVPFPWRIRAEWFVVDLIEHHHMAGVPLSVMREHLVVRLRQRRFRADTLRAMAARFGSKTTQELVRGCIEEVLTARMVGIGMNFAAEPEVDANIERTLLQSSSFGMEYGDLRTLSILTTWLGFHHACVNVDELGHMVREHRSSRVRAYWAAIGSWLKKDPAFARLNRLHGGSPVDVLPTGTDFQLKRRGEDERFVGTALRAPHGTLPDRAADVLTPALLARRHAGYRERLREARRNPRTRARLAEEERQQQEAVEAAINKIVPMVRGLAELQEQARSQGHFIEPREMLTCDECGLSEDEERDGRFLVREHGGDGPDTGLRFIADEKDEAHFTCPACGAEVRLDPLEDLDGW